MKGRLQPGDYAVRDGAGYPDTIYRVEEVDEHGNFRGTPVFRLASNGPWKRVGQWLGGFRKVSRREIEDWRSALEGLEPRA